MSNDEKIESAASRPDIFGKFKWMTGEPPMVEQSKRTEKAMEWDELSEIFDKEEKEPKSTKPWTDGEYINSGDIAILAENGYDDSETRHEFVGYLTRDKSHGAKFLQGLVAQYFAFPKNYETRKLIPDPFGPKNVDFAIVIDDTIKGLIEVDRFQRWYSLHDMTLDELRKSKLSFNATVEEILEDEISPNNPVYHMNRQQIYEAYAEQQLVKWPDNYSRVHFLERKARYLEKPYPYLHLSFSSRHNCAVAYIRETIVGRSPEYYKITCEPGMVKKDKVRRIHHDQCFMIDFAYDPTWKYLDRGYKKGYTDFMYSFEWNSGENLQRHLQNVLAPMQGF